jgi:hypothetical protein
MMGNVSCSVEHLQRMLPIRGPIWVSKMGFVTKRQAIIHRVCKRFVKCAVLELAKKLLEEQSMNLGFLEGINVTRKSNNLVVAVHRYGAFIYTQEHFFRGH